MSVTRGQGNVRNLLFTHLWPAGTAVVNAIARQPEWMADGLFAQVDGDMFFPEKGGSTKEAKSVCAGCPVRGECLEYALDNDERFGVWGGLSERERRRLTRQPLPVRQVGDRDTLCSECQQTFRSPRGLRLHVRRWCAA